MKKIKKLFLSFLVFASIGCSTQQVEKVHPTVIPTEEIIASFDFDHPRLYEIAGENPLVIREIARTARGIDGTPYVAVIVDTSDPIFRVKVLIFRLENQAVSLIYESDAYYYLSFNIASLDPDWLIENSNYYYYRSFSGGIYSIDENYLILPFEASNGGNCYDCAGMRVIGISENGLAKDITPVAPFTSKTFFDINGSFKFEIVATRYYESSYGAISRAGSPYAFRLYAWNGKEFIDVSENEKEFFDQKIADAVSQLQKTYGTPFKSHIVMPLLSQIFFNYESSGRTEYGWKQIQELGDLKHWDIQNTTPEDIQTYHDVFIQLEQRKKP